MHVNVKFNIVGIKKSFIKEYIFLNVLFAWEREGKLSENERLFQ